MLSVSAHIPQVATFPSPCRGIIRTPISYTPSEEPSITIGDNVWAPVTIHFQGERSSGHVLTHYGDSELGRELGSISRLDVPVLLGDAACKAAGADGGFCQWSRLILLRRKHIESTSIPGTLVHEAEHARTFVGAQRGSLKALTELSYIKRDRLTYGEFVVNEIQAHLDDFSSALHQMNYPHSLLQKIAYLASDTHLSHTMIRSFLSSSSRAVAYLDTLKNKHAMAAALSTAVRTGDMFFPTVEIALPGPDVYACCIALPQRCALLEPGSPELVEIIVERMEAFSRRLREQSNMMKESFSAWGIPRKPLG